GKKGEILKISSEHTPLILREGRRQIGDGREVV
ncbi:unnamed protein product, partial [marine sediment metagenome]